MSTSQTLANNDIKYRVCTLCGAVRGLDFGTKRCRCGGKYNVSLCSSCGDAYEVSNLNAHSKCVSCQANGKRRALLRRERMRQRRYAAAKELHNELVKAHDNAMQYLIDYGLTRKPVNKYHWYRTVQYFDGCCLCDPGEADIQWLFIRPKNGGKYEGSNVLPCCESCRELLNKYDNPLLALDARINKKAPVDGLKRLQKALRYIGYDI